ncbi:MAG: DUF4271 domain-containing protein [Bacteroidota bacterium]
MPQSAFSGNVPAPVKDPAVVRNLASEWQTFDTRFQGYVTFSPDLHGRPEALSIWLDCLQDRYALRMPVTPGLCLFADKRLFRAFNKNQTVIISLPPIMDSVGGRRIFITLYHPNGIIPWQNAELVNLNVSAEEAAIVPADTTESDSIKAALPIEPAIKQGVPFRIQPGKRAPMRMPWYCLIILLAVASAYTVILNYSPATFLPFFEFSNFLVRDVEIYNLGSRRLRNTDLFLLIPVNSLAISMVVFLIHYSGKDSGPVNGIMQASGFMFSVAAALPAFFAVALSYFMIKYALLQTVSKLLGYAIPGKPHWYEFIRFSTLFSITLLVMVLPVYGTHIISLPNFIWLIRFFILLFFAARVFRIGLILNRPDRFRFLYLFSYLCATEIVPMVFILKLIS